MFCFLKTMCLLCHQESDFQSSFYAAVCYKDVKMNCSKIIIDKRQNKSSEPIAWLLCNSQKGRVSLTGKGGWYRWDKNNIKSCKRFQHLRALFIHFMQFCGPCITQK